MFIPVEYFGIVRFNISLINSLLFLWVDYLPDQLIGIDSKWMFLYVWLNLTLIDVSKHADTKKDIGIMHSFVYLCIFGFKKN